MDASSDRPARNLLTDGSTVLEGLQLGEIGVDLLGAL